MATPSSEPARLDAQGRGDQAPLILIDPSTITLLPDASLTLDPPAPPVVPGQTKDRPD
jgi:hypothetical protein